MNSYQIKHALLYYFRFKRQWICASECMNNDVMAFSKKNIIEVEIKSNKYDLWKGEAKKRKHKYYTNINNYNFVPNKFYICTPKDLIEEAFKWVETTNNKYGIIECHNMYNVTILKKAGFLHRKPYSEYIKDRVMKRVCSENINFFGRFLNEKNIIR